MTPRESKYARANAVAPFIEGGNVFLPAPDVALFDPEELITEASSFPQGAHDNQVDACSQALAALLLDSSSADAWLAWARRKAIKAGAVIVGPGYGDAGAAARDRAPSARQGCRDRR